MTVLTKNELKKISSLQQRKFREEYGLFVVEGVKMVNELLQSDWEVQTICSTADWVVPEGAASRGFDHYTVNQKELERMSSMRNPDRVLAVVKQPQSQTIPDEWPKGLVLALDDVRDPGNLGTILRSAEWFGVALVVLSGQSVERWNRKVVQASMGSVLRVPVITTSLTEAVKSYKEQGGEVIGAVLDGDPLGAGSLPTDGMLVMGSESHGLSDEVSELLTKRVRIPSFGQAESLNVAMATGILLYEYRRQD